MGSATFMDFNKLNKKRQAPKIEQITETNSEGHSTQPGINQTGSRTKLIRQRQDELSNFDPNNEKMMNDLMLDINGELSEDEDANRIQNSKLTK